MNPFSDSSIRSTQRAAKQLKDKQDEIVRLEAALREIKEKPEREARALKSKQTFSEQTKDALVRDGNVVYTQWANRIYVGRVSAKEVHRYNCISFDAFQEIERDLRAAGYSTYTSGSDSHYSDDGPYGDGGSRITVNYIRFRK